VCRRAARNNPKLFNSIFGIIMAMQITFAIIWILGEFNRINIPLESLNEMSVFGSVLIGIDVIILLIGCYLKSSFPFSICNSLKLDSLVKDLN
jgi:hypothetical protein